MNNCLAVIAHKCARNVFDLSSRLTEYSIRDQIVRAAIFADQLVESEQVDPSATVLVIGAGVTGVTAAAKLASRGTKVILLEMNPLPFLPMRSCTERYVGPYMYEWPASFHQSQAFPMSASAAGDPACPSWNFPDPIPVNEFVTVHLDRWLKDYLTINAASAKKSLECYVSADGEKVQEFVKHFVEQKTLMSVQSLELNGCKLNPDFTADPLTLIKVGKPRCIILAPGVGRETLEIGDSGQTTPFWKNDNLKNGSTSRHIGILGGGDGALQDFLRAALICNHPLEAVRTDPAYEPLLRKAYLELLSAEMANKRLSGWGFINEGSRYAALACDAAAAQLVASHGSACRDFIDRILRSGSGSVSLIRENANEKRCYLLNRFLVALLARAYNKADHPGKVRLRFISHTGKITDTQVTRRKGKIRLGLNFRMYACDQLVVRFGLGGGMSRGEQMVSLARHPEPARINFVHLPLPFSPP